MLRRMAKTTSLHRIAANVRAEATRHNVTGLQIADALGLTPPATSRRMHGHVAFSGPELDKLAELLDVPVGTFFGDQVSA